MSGKSYLTIGGEQWAKKEGAPLERTSIIICQYRRITKLKKCQNLLNTL